MEDKEAEILEKYSIEEILKRKELPEEIILVAEQERKKLEEKFKDNDLWKRLPDKKKYFGIASVFTWEDYIDLKKSIIDISNKINIKSIYSNAHNCHSHGIVNTEGKIGILDPLPNADWPLRRSLK